MALSDGAKLSERSQKSAPARDDFGAALVFLARLLLLLLLMGEFGLVVRGLVKFSYADLAYSTKPLRLLLALYFFAYRSVLDCYLLGVWAFGGACLSEDAFGALVCLLTVTDVYTAVVFGSLQPRKSKALWTSHDRFAARINGARTWFVRSLILVFLAEALFNTISLSRSTDDLEVTSPSLMKSDGETASSSAAQEEQIGSTSTGSDARTGSEAENSAEKTKTATSSHLLSPGGGARLALLGSHYVLQEVAKVRRRCDVLLRDAAWVLVEALYQESLSTTTRDRLAGNTAGNRRLPKRTGKASAELADRSTWVSSFSEGESVALLSTFLDLFPPELVERCMHYAERGRRLANDALEASQVRTYLFAPLQPHLHQLHDSAAPVLGYASELLAVAQSASSTIYGIDEPEGIAELLQPPVERVLRTLMAKKIFWFLHSAPDPARDLWLLDQHDEPQQSGASKETSTDEVDEAAEDADEDDDVRDDVTDADSRDGKSGTSETDDSTGTPTGRRKSAVVDHDYDEVGGPIEANPTTKGSVSDLLQEPEELAAKYADPHEAWVASQLGEGWKRGTSSLITIPVNENLAFPVDPDDPDYQEQERILRQNHEEQEAEQQKLQEEVNARLVSERRRRRERRETARRKRHPLHRYNVVVRSALDVLRDWLHRCDFKDLEEYLRHHIGTNVVGSENWDKFLRCESCADLRRSYRRVSLDFHPDRFHGSYCSDFRAGAFRVLQNLLEERKKRMQCDIRES
ncbi:unnamed protein product [Amoebophrya sp. A25]|nr:unnamed protein product [Amoebophrya sp. A25]|eukprot:GSA25T00023683001.1